MWDNILASTIVISIFLSFVFILVQILNAFGLKKKKAYFRELHTSLKPGIRVLVNGTLYGKLVKVYDESCIIEIAKGVEVRVSRYSISEIVKED